VFPQNLTALHILQLPSATDNYYGDVDFIFQQDLPKKYQLDADSSSAVKDMMRGLDDNQDGKVSFQEYLNLVGYVANAWSERKTGTQNSAAN
uniref:Si:ch211-105c13.3 n=1 Tax=Astyanax mexicanus TaxID=7994 RepID=A0A8B9JFW5_ASTMX